MKGVGCWVLGAGLALPASLAAQQALRPTVLAMGVTATYEDNARPGGEHFIRLPVTITLGLGTPRNTQLEIEGGAGFHSLGDSTDATGAAFTRIRFFHFFNAAGRFSIGPDAEVFLKTESSPRLGFGYARFLPGLVLGYRIHGALRTIVRARYEFTSDESPGTAGKRRLAVRPALFFTPRGAWSGWLRGDAIVDLRGAPPQYNVELNAARRFGRSARLGAFIQPRLYLGDAARARNSWRLRIGALYSLGGVILRH